MYRYLIYLMKEFTQKENYLKCPYCLVNQINQVHSKIGIYQCNNCKTIIPKGYMNDKNAQKHTIGLVGYSGHGKTAYLTSLFSELTNVSKHWNNFYYRSLDNFTHTLLYIKVPKFFKNILPESTPVNFPNPALIYYNNIPYYESNAYFNYYDIAGETFNDINTSINNAYFIAHANTILFTISLIDCDQSKLDEEFCKLLDTYLIAVNDILKIKTKETQKIIDRKSVV